MIYPEATHRDYALHTGPRFGAIRNPNPEALPDINVPVDALHARPTGVAGVSRKMIFDYAVAGGGHRYAQMCMLPGSTTPVFTTGAPLADSAKYQQISIDPGIEQRHSERFKIVHLSRCDRKIVLHGCGGDQSVGERLRLSGAFRAHRDLRPTRRYRFIDREDASGKTAAELVCPRRQRSAAPSWRELRSPSANFADSDR